MTKQNHWAEVEEAGNDVDNLAAAVKKWKSGVAGGGAQKSRACPGGGRFVGAAAAAMSERNRMALKDLEINGVARINSWVDSMRASSPTHIKLTPSSSLSSSSSSTDQHLKYSSSSWIASALDEFDEIVKVSKGKQIVMFLDYDGTLSPIVDDPDRAFMSDAMRSTLKKVAKYFPTAIVTGRCRHKVYNFVRLAELYYAGSHGMDIKGPTKSSRYKYWINSSTINVSTSQEAVQFQPANDFLPMIDDVYEALVDKTKSILGAKVENNKFCVSVHFRCVHDKKWSELAQEVRSVLKQYPSLRLTQGRKVLEIRPMIKWDKGRALVFLLESLGLANRKDVFPVYIGDDRTDEDAFKVLKERGQGLGILVSRFPEETNGSYYLQEPAEVLDFLQRLVKRKRFYLPS